MGLIDVIRRLRMAGWEFDDIRAAIAAVEVEQTLQDGPITVSGLSSDGKNPTYRDYRRDAIVHFDSQALGDEPV